MQSYPTKNLRRGNGYLEVRSGSWRYRFYANIQLDGKIVRKQIGAVLGSIHEMDEEDAVQAANEYRLRVNAGAIVRTKFTNMSAREFFPVARASHFGAIAEYIASCNLMCLGLEVFRNMNPTGTVDLIALDGSGKSYRVEVKSGPVSASGTKHSVYRKHLRSGRYDVLAVVDKEWRVYYFDKDNKPICFTREGVIENSASKPGLSTEKIVCIGRLVAASD